MKGTGCPKRSKPSSDLDENDAKHGPEKVDKHKRKKLRRKRASSSPEEDIIDGFVIASYSNLLSLEVVSSNTPECTPVLSTKQLTEDVNLMITSQETKEEKTRLPTKNQQEKLDVNANENAVVKEGNIDGVSKPEIDLSRKSPSQMTDDSSESGNSERGYICDGESEDEQVIEVPVPQEKRPDSPQTKAIEPKKEPPMKVDLSKDDDEKPIKNEKPFQIDFDMPKPLFSPKTSSFCHPSVSISSSLEIPQCSHPAPQSSWLSRLSSSSFKKPLPSFEHGRSSGAYAGPDALHQELNNRFLQSHSELERNSLNSKSSGHEMHQHLHHHQHQHTHYYPSPLLGSHYFPTPAPLPNVLSPFSTPVPTYGSHVVSPFTKKTGKWCAAHVQIAWKIYCHQRVQGEMKGSYGKHEGIPFGKPSTTIIPPFPSRHSELGFNSSHLSRKFSGSPFGRPPVLIPSNNNTSTTGTTVSSISAFSSVPSPLISSRRPGSPLATSRPQTHGRRSPRSGGSSPYPWLKSERRTPDVESGKPRALSAKRESRSRSPVRPSNFTIQALASSDSAEIRPMPFGDSARIHSSREHRPCETRSLLDNPLFPSLGSVDKRPLDYHRRAEGSIDLNRNSLYSRFEPMHPLYSHHVPSLAPHISGYPYPSSAILSDYHSSSRHPMLLGTRDPMVLSTRDPMVLSTRDPMASLVRTSDTPFYIRHDLEQRFGGVFSDRR